MRISIKYPTLFSLNRYRCGLQDTHLCTKRNLVRGRKPPNPHLVFYSNAPINEYAKSINSFASDKYLAAVEISPFL